MESKRIFWESLKYTSNLWIKQFVGIIGIILSFLSLKILGKTYFESFYFSLIIIPVSYTHLDVYKRQHLNHLSKEFAGVSPKTLSSLNRLQNTLKTISGSPTEKLTNVAYELEYFDQAHFINDFKKFTDLTPNEYANLVEKTQSLKIAPHFIPFQ